MRKLSDIETQIIKDRLDRLLIAYVEIYDELLDHYVTSLEQLPAEQFQTKKVALDDEFAWSVVKGMEKQLIKTAWKEIGIASKSRYKIWKLGPKKMAIMVLFLIVTTFTFQLFGSEYFYVLAVGSFGCLMFLIIYLNRKNLSLNLSIDPEKNRPKKVLTIALLSISVLALNLVNLIAVLLPKLLVNSSYEYLIPFIFLSLGTLILAFSWMIYNTIDFKTFKMIKS